VNPYGASRVFQQMLIDIYTKNYGLDIVHSRSFNHLGPYQTKDFVVSSFTRQVASQLNEDKDPIVLKVGNVDVVRDFTDVRDVVVAYYKLLISGKSGEIYNVCSGQGYVLKDVIQMIEGIVGKTVAWSSEKDILRPADNQKIIGSYSKLQKETGWKPRITMQQSLSDLILYWKETTSGLLLS
jgi:GDP-4-dehydro-6-deoxy-D-mannose reductase